MHIVISGRGSKSTAQRPAESPAEVKYGVFHIRKLKQ